MSLRFGVTTPNVIECNKESDDGKCKESFWSSIVKFDQVSFLLICPVNTIDYIVTTGSKNQKEYSTRKLASES